jgi:hypothetical protein
MKQLPALYNFIYSNYCTQMYWTILLRLCWIRGSFKFKREFGSLSSTNQLVWTCLCRQVMTCLNLQPALVRSLSTSNIRCNQDGSASSTQQCCAAYNYQISHEGRCHSFWNLYQASSTVWGWMFVMAKGVQLGEIISRRTRPCWKWMSRSATKNFCQSRQRFENWWTYSG